MKKTIVLGVLAFFAINIATVQNANAQDKKKVNTTSTTEVNAEKANKEAVKMEKAKPEIKSEKAAKEKELKATEKKELKATEKKEVKATEKKVAEKEATEKKVTTKDDPTAKKVKPNKTVPPAEKEKRAASGATKTDR